MVFLRHKASNMPHNVFVFQIVFLANLITNFWVIDKALDVYCIWNQHIVIFIYHFLSKIAFCSLDTTRKMMRHICGKASLTNKLDWKLPVFRYACSMCMKNAHRNFAHFGSMKCIHAKCPIVRLNDFIFWMFLKQFSHVFQVHRILGRIQSRCMINSTAHRFYFIVIRSRFFLIA